MVEAKPPSLTRKPARAWRQRSSQSRLPRFSQVWQEVRVRREKLERRIVTVAGLFIFVFLFGLSWVRVVMKPGEEGDTEANK